MSEPSPLSELQRWMVSLLVQPRSLVDSPQFHGEALRHIATSGRLSPLEQLEIYREQFWLRHTGSLLEDFPGLSRLLGQTAWEAVVEGYLAAYPPSSPSLRDLGRELPRYLEQHPALERRELLVDLAKVEWAYIDCFDAADAPELDRTRLAQLSPSDWESGQVLLAPALRLLELRFPAADVRRSLLSGAALRASEQPEPVFLVVYRQADGTLWDKQVSRTALRLLAEFARGLPLVAACDAVALALPEAEAELEVELSNWFSSWGKLGWICGFERGHATFTSE